MLKVLIVEPGKEPYAKEIGSDLASLQKEVGGLIEICYPSDDDPVVFVINEEGKLTGLPLNRGLLDEKGALWDIIAGTFFVVGLGDEDFVSLSDELLEKYRERFLLPEFFVSLNGEVKIFRIKKGEI